MEEVETATKELQQRPRVTIKTNTKNKRSWEITTYGDTIDEAKKEAIRIDKELNKQYREGEN